MPTYGVVQRKPSGIACGQTTEAEERLLQVVSVALVTADDVAFREKFWPLSGTEIPLVDLAL